MTNKRILFVDDEPYVLDGLRDLLRKDRRRWDMTFVTSGAEALATLEREPFDVVVSDMRMPGMDGAELLGRVKEAFPGLARLVLSGHAERDAVLRVLPVAHQFLSKPCEADVLRAAIERTCELQRLLTNDRVRAVVGGLDRLPSLPKIYTELVAVAGAPDSSIADVAHLVQRDPAMSAKVLQLANSAYFGLSQPVSTVQNAVLYLGLELIKGLVLTAHVFATANLPSDCGLVLEDLQAHSLLVARVARKLLSDPKRAEQAFAAGLVHDIGLIILASKMPDTYRDIGARLRTSGAGRHVVEQEVLGLDHGEVGAFLLGMWGVPFSLVEAVAYHHHPGAVTEGACDVLAALHMADACVSSARRGGAADGMDTAFLEHAGFSHDLPRWQAIAAIELGGGRAG